MFSPVKRCSHQIIGAALFCGFLATPAFATNGYLTHGIGTHNKALAGSGDATPRMAIDAANNPASGVKLPRSLDLGLAIFSPRREYSVSESQLNGQFGAFSLAEGTVKSDRDYFVIPYLAKNWRLDDNSAVTLSTYGRGGMNTDYRGGAASFDPDGPGPAPVGTFRGTFGAGDAGVNLSQAFLEIAYSMQRADWSLGIAPVIAYQMFEATGLASFAPFTRTFAASGGTQSPENLTDRGSDSSFGYGVKLGAIWQASEALALSLAYQSETKMDAFDDYSDLFAESGDFDIPASTRLGISYAVAPRVMLHFDIEHTQYGDVGSVGNPLSSVIGCPSAGLGGTEIENCLGGKEGFGFGWDDVTVYQAGIEWQPSALPNLTWLAGYNYGEQPIDDSDAVINILAPGVVEQHFTGGFRLMLDSGDMLSAAIMYAPKKSVSGANFFDPTQQVELSMKQFEIEVSYTFN
ncbi:SalD [Luminiphilus syltensis NOR5-1B]|uniref:SalD n=1 Tax=Luminiphilus syltensis NOR5-1B TaxID=565045 RepID=B8KTR2_9GAMM|nr:outer membrane protein transport protein [Luminiphilus syltensis]EED36954.1 SalD [Luminiphilus syltensis NOR5-1B]